MKDLLRKFDVASRRQFVTRAAKTFLGLSLAPMVAGSRSVLGATANAVNAPKGPNGEYRNLIYLYMSGGMTHLDTFDPKPQTPEVAGPVNAINTNADGIQLAEYMPELARQSDKICVVRGMHSTQGAHEQGRYFMHTSYTRRGTIRHPNIGVWMSKLQGRRNPKLPANVHIGGSAADAHAGYWEGKYAPLIIGDPDKGLQNVNLPEDITEKQFEHRMSLAEDFDRAFRRRYDFQSVRAYTDMYDDAIELMRSEDVKAFDLAFEDDAIRDMYGDNRFGQGCLLARRLVQSGIRFVEVTLGGWDTHTDNFNSVQPRAATLDQALASLLADLERNGMLDNTLVALATEFGRTPHINVNEGRDHFPKAFSCLLAGGGIKRGSVYGVTDERGENVVDQPVSIPDFNATIATAVGLDVDKVHFSPQKRPFQVAHKGQPIKEMLA